MERSKPEFAPPLVGGAAHRGCRAVVILPVRDEAGTLPASLRALTEQVDLDGRRLAPESYEVLVLLNNCRDGSGAVARAWAEGHPRLRLHLVEAELEQERAHAGTARRMLMDAAWLRLTARGPGVGVGAILSTDADTQVAPDWIAQNLRALGAGADAVGGEIRLKTGHLEALPQGARLAYLADQRYQLLVAELEHVLDPRAHDPWPRHLHHFGASLGCTADAYARAGGLPAERSLEDVAFVGALARSGARLRHDPAVVVYTSGRLDGRAEVGLSGQLRLWQEMSEAGERHTVPAAAWLRHRMETVAWMRGLWRRARLPEMAGIGTRWRVRIALAHVRRGSEAEFLEDAGCEEMAAETFAGERYEEIGRASAKLLRELRRRMEPEEVRCSGDLDPQSIGKEGVRCSEDEDASLLVPVRRGGTGLDGRRGGVSTPGERATPDGPDLR